MKHLQAQPHSSLSAFGTGAGGASRRRQPRNALRCPVRIAMAGGIERSGTTVDLSHDGLSLSTDKPIPPGSRCTLRLLTPTGNGNEPLQIDVKSVYSSYTAPGDFRIGVVFVGLEAEVVDALRALAADA